MHTVHGWLSVKQAGLRLVGPLVSSVVTEETKSFWLNAERICESLQLQSGLFI